MWGKKKKIYHDDDVVVIGLGRFGGSVALSLVRLGHEVVAMDERENIVQRFADHLTYVIQADSTQKDALLQLGVTSKTRVVVAIGTDIEASVLTVLALTEIGVKEIWAKAINSNHGRILQRVGAHHVVYPEADMGKRVAHTVTGKMIDFIEFEDGFAIVKTGAPADIVGHTLAESKLRTRYGVTVVGVKRRGQGFTYALPETIIKSTDILVVSGVTQKVERFAAQT